SGTHSITADYSGNANFNTSTGTLSGGQVVSGRPSLSINDVSIIEGDSGTKTLNFTVTLSAASSLPVRVNYATANGTASAPSDYTAIETTALTFNPGDLTKTLGVTINGDTSFEPNETFFVDLSNPVNASISDNQGTGAIINDDAQGANVSFSSATYSVNENTSLVTLVVNRAGDTTAALAVDYATDDMGAPSACGTSNGVASSRCDFTTATGTLAFAAGETQKAVNVLINNDSYAEGPEAFTVNLSNLTGGAAFIVPSSATVTIMDSATGPPANLIDDASFFVRQHYHDFLNREPDAQGLAFWTNEITACGAIAQCVEVKRINVSASFLLSIEFQGTGGAAYLTNKVAYGAMPSYVRFETDAQALGRNYVFGQPGAEAILEANKIAYFNEYVTRTDFTNLYNGLSDQTYVSALISNAGVAFTQDERDVLVNGLANHTETRATVLRKLTEKPTLEQAEFTRVFVLLEYFGYLRRDPDTAGFNFWLGKLNDFNGNFIQTEMVKAFLSSSEYRRRFGP
ncbi:MAG: Calx-beta domain-containing protein, partial [Pyrinomonadaceae bacterium]